MMIKVADVRLASIAIGHDNIHRSLLVLLDDLSGSIRIVGADHHLDLPEAGEAGLALAAQLAGNSLGVQSPLDDLATIGVGQGVYGHQFILIHGRLPLVYGKNALSSDKRMDGANVCQMLC